MMKKKDEGFTLLEVLVAIVVFSFGLLGVAGMMTISVRSNHNGYLRSQANFLAENMMDRMRANPVALWRDFYSGTAVTGTSECKIGQECNYQDLATFDREQWAQSIESILPSGEGEILCENTATLRGGILPANAPSIWFPAPPYSGVCTVTITWQEANRGGTADEQTLVLVATP